MEIITIISLNFLKQAILLKIIAMNSALKDCNLCYYELINVAILFIFCLKNLFLLEIKDKVPLNYLITISIY